MKELLIRVLFVLFVFCSAVCMDIEKPEECSSGFYFPSDIDYSCNDVVFYPLKVGITSYEFLNLKSLYYLAVNKNGYEFEVVFTAYPCNIEKKSYRDFFVDFSITKGEYPSYEDLYATACLSMYLFADKQYDINGNFLSFTKTNNQNKNINFVTTVVDKKYSDWLNKMEFLDFENGLSFLSQFGDFFQVNKDSNKALFFKQISYSIQYKID